MEMIPTRNGSLYIFFVHLNQKKSCFRLLGTLENIEIMIMLSRWRSQMGESSVNVIWVNRSDFIPVHF